MSTMVKFTIVFLLLVAVFDAGAQKPHKNQHLEILPNEQESFVRFDDGRISKETGAPLALYRVDYPVKAGSPQEMAEQYLRENARILKIKRDLSDLQFSSVRETPGGYHIRFKQYAYGYPVYRGDIVVNLDRQNRITFVMNGYKPVIRLTETSPKITRERAEQIAMDYLQIKGRLNYQKKETVVYHNKGITRLAHKITLVPAEDVFGDWEVLVDAVSGEIFKVKDNACYLSPTTGMGKVFDPDPLTHARAVYQSGGQFGDNNDNDTDSLVAQIVWRELPDIEFYNNQYHLEGPYAAIQDFESPFKGLFSQSDSVWDFTRNPDAFEAVNAYFHVDQSMRYINDTLGFV